MIGLNDVKSYNTIKDLLLENTMLTIVKAQMLNKPYIHYIDVKIMNASANERFLFTIDVLNS